MRKISMKVLSVLCVMALIISSISCIFAFSVSAVNQNPTTFYFSDASQVKALSGRATVADGTLNMIAYKYTQARAKLDYELEEGKTYKISFDATISYPEGSEKSNVLFRLHTASAESNEWTLFYSNYVKTEEATTFDLNETETILYSMNGANQDIKTKYEFEFTVNSLPVDHKYLGIFFQPGSDDTSIAIDNMTITDMNVNLTEGYTVLKEFTFDEENTNYWSAVTNENTTDNSVGMNFTVSEGGYEGSALNTPFGLYDNAFLSFDYALKSNTKYMVAYKYKANNSSASLNHNSSKIMVGNADASNYSELAQFTASSGWAAIGTGWTTRTAIIETGMVRNDANSLIFKLSFGKDGIFYLDNISIREIVETSSYENDFENGLNNTDVFNYNSTLEMQVVADPLDSENNVLKFAKAEASGAVYNLYIPVKVVAGNTYTISYNYRTDATSQLSMNNNAKIGIVNNKGDIATEIGYFAANAVHNGGWGKVNVSDSWTTRTITYTPTEEDIASSTGNIMIKVAIYNSPTAALNLYLDNLSVVKHSRVTFEANGGTVDTAYVTGLKGTEIELPTPTLDGAIFRGWYTDAELTVAANNVMPADDTTYYAKWEVSSNYAEFTFDEENTDYWNSNTFTSATSSYSTNKVVKGSGGLSGNALQLAFEAYDKVTIGFDYSLKSNAKYLVSYQYKASAGSYNASQTGILSVGDVIADSFVVGSYATNRYAYFTASSTGWINIGSSWSTRTAVIETGNVPADQNRLALRMAFGNSGTFYLDNIKVIEIPSNENYSADFTNGLEDAGLFAYNAESNFVTDNIEVVADPTDENNSVLKLRKADSTPTYYKIVLPIELVEGNKYTISYRYRTDISEQGLSTDSKIGILDANGILSTEIGYFAINAAANNGWGRIDSNWTDRALDFTATTDNVHTGTLVMLIRPLEYAPYTAESNIYIDDIKIIKHGTITFEPNGGTVDSGSITATRGSIIELPIPTKDGYSFKGWYTDAELTVKADNVMPSEDTTYYAYWYIKGDANGDGDVDPLDLIVLRKILLSDTVEYSADGIYCNDDNVVDVRDLVRLKKMIAGVYTSYIPSNYNLVWSEEFDGSSVEDTQMVLASGHSKGENSVNTAENVAIENGNAVMSVNYDSENSQYNLPLSLSTNDTMNFKYGFIEIRANVPYMAKGEWPAFWLLSSSAELAKQMDGYSVPDYYAEIDLFEQITYGKKFQTQLHLWANSDTSHIENILGSNSKYTFESLEEANGWHTYGFKWTEDDIKVYVDGELALTAVIANEYKQYFGQYSPLRLSLQYKETGTFFTENPDSSIEMEIDYVRLYQDSTTDNILVKSKKKQ